VLAYSFVKQFHPALDIQRGTDPGQGQAKFHQGDGHRWLHADQHGLGIHDARQPGDGADHPADERIHHVQGGDIDQHAAGGGPADALGQVVLQGQGQLVMHVHLDGHQQEVAHLQNRNALHRLSPPC
jgi:hypothetical protein